MDKKTMKQTFDLILLENLMKYLLLCFFCCMLNLIKNGLTSLNKTNSKQIIKSKKPPKFSHKVGKQFCAKTLLPTIA